MKIDTNRIRYVLLRFLAGIAWGLPFWLLYILSDIGYFFLYKVFSYRLKIVRKNLKNSFPEKTDVELREIERKFYHHLCDYGIETLKLYTLPTARTKRRMIFKNTEQMENIFRSGRPIFVLMGHYANWEYITTVPLWFKHLPQVEFAHVYRPLHDEAMDRFIFEMRGRRGSQNVSENQLLRWLFKKKQEGKTYLFGALAEQIPRQTGSIQFVNFLHQDTPFYNGIMKLAGQLGTAVGFFDIHRVRRGHYEATFKLLTDRATKTDAEEITNRYAYELEQSILQFPPYWLWTHNRWKRGRNMYREVKHT